MKRMIRVGASGWFVGDPDPTGRLEAELRDAQRAKMTWRDAYNEFLDLVDKYFPDEERIERRVRFLYNEHRGDPLWDEAYRRWIEDQEDPEDQ